MCFTEGVLSSFVLTSVCMMAALRMISFLELPYLLCTPCPVRLPQAASLSLSLSLKHIHTLFVLFLRPLALSLYSVCQPRAVTTQLMCLCSDVDPDVGLFSENSNSTQAHRGQPL